LAALLVGLAGASAAQASRAPLWSWSAAEGRAAWAINSDVADVADDANGLTFRTIGPDPIFELRTLFDIAATPWETVEIRLKASRDGLAELFWTGTTAGKYGGFSGEKVTRFAIRGDGAWRTYVVHPFWQKEGRIIRLRFDPYSGSEFALGSIRIVGQPSAPRAASAGADLAPALRSLRDVTVSSGAAGVRLGLAAPDGIALAPASVAAEQSHIVALRAASRADRASLLFATDGAYGLGEVSIALTPDGREHTYNLDMLAYPGWKGKVLALGLRPGAKAGDRCTVRSLVVSDRPRGLADVVVMWFVLV
jgi:hypothetical protein